MLDVTLQGRVYLKEFHMMAEGKQIHLDQDASVDSRLIIGNQF